MIYQIIFWGLMVNRLTEVAIIDMFLSFGIIGTIIFLTLFLKIYHESIVQF